MNGQGRIGELPWMRIGRTLYFGADTYFPDAVAVFRSAMQAQRHLDYLIEQARLIAELRQQIAESQTYQPR